MTTPFGNILLLSTILGTTQTTTQFVNSEVGKLQLTVR